LEDLKLGSDADILAARPLRRDALEQNRSGEISAQLYHGRAGKHRTHKIFFQSGTVQLRKRFKAGAGFGAESDRQPAHL
jgi:hypothetical protein